MAIILLLIAVFVFSFLFLYQWRINNRNNPPVPNWPMFGMVPSLILNVHRIHDYTVDIMSKTHGTHEFKGPPFSKFSFILTSDPINVNHVLSRNFSNYEKGPEFREIFESMGNGILASDSDSWKSQRRMIHSLVNNHGFETTLMKTVRKKGLHGLIPILDHAAENKVEVDLKVLIHRLVFDILSIIMLGIDTESLSIKLPKVEYMTAIAEIEEAVIYRHIVPSSVWKLQRWFRIGEEKNTIKNLKILDQHIYQCILSSSQKLQTMQADDANANANTNANAKGEVRNDQEEQNVLTKLLSSSLLSSDQEMMSSKMLRDHVFNLIVAGHDTVSATLSWFFWCVSKYPSVGSKIAEEIDTVFPREEDAGKHDHILDKKRLDKMIYLHATILEVLRLYPPVPINHKTSIQGDTLPTGHRVKPSGRVLISYYAMARMKEIWGDDCLEFKPERWILSATATQDVKSLIHVPSHVFATFNSGPRLCVGKEMALIEIKMVAIMVIRDYNIRLVENHPAGVARSVVLKMKAKLKVMITKKK